ncbi:MAG: Crp/Fnr family transcriptional regulator [Candidatus Marinimicrobia bacterium]|jgi:CRP-like cAMP-binding protein|nr:Crp/Fnr family transcriptional regulator [Candidatus Neomarinimicrobiota bacterium]MDP6819898.1 Crp/Fnr family transcriptional regulator [Candidatus Neomarinimicrobiota bacterium]|tara:strand:+ start:2908 stop:3588 length:681 start_codon:yes stop_codon:yes gene_type:complete
MNSAEYLRSVSIFSDLSDVELVSISKKMTPYSYSKGEFIVMEEMEGQQCYFITHGSVKITRSSKEGREVILAILTAGEFFGEMSLLDGETRSANVLTLEETKVLALNRNDFMATLEEYPRVSIQLLKELTIRLRKSDLQIASLTLSDAEKRIGLCILRLAGEQGTIRQGHVKIKKFPFQHDIANMAGTSRETVSRTLVLFEQNGLIQREGRQLTIVDYMQFQREFD